MKWGRVVAGAVGGAAGAAATLASKYIDEELLQQRQQTFLEMQRKNTLLTESELDAQRNAPERLARDRENARQGVLAKASAEREGVVAGQSDAAYQGALDQSTLMETRRRVKAENDLVEGTKGAKLTAEQERIRALLPFEKEKAEALADIEVRKQTRISNNTTDGQIRRMEAAAKRAEERRIGPDGKPIKLSEIGEIELKSIVKQEQELEKLKDEAIAGGSLMPGNKDHAQALDHFKQRAASLKVAKIGVLVKEGLIDPVDAAKKVIQGESDPNKLAQSKQQAVLFGGQYAREFSAVIDAHLGKMPKPGGASATGGATAPAGSSRSMETLPGSQTADGQPRYRLPGQSRWYASKQEARDAAWKPQRSAAEPMPENLDAGF